MKRSRHTIVLTGLVVAAVAAGVLVRCGARSRAIVAASDTRSAGNATSAAMRAGDTGTLEGQVVHPHGTAVGGATIALMPLDGSSAVEVVVADARGRFARGLDAGRFAIAATSPLGASASTEVVLVAGEVVTVELVVADVGIELHGLVEDRAGGAIGAPFIVARSLAGPGIYASVGKEDGGYRLRVPAGPYRVTARAEGYAEGARLVDVAVSQSLGFQLWPAAAIRGRVVRAADGRPVAGAEVELSGRGVAVARTTRSVADGRFELGGLGAGSYLLVARGEGQIGVVPAPVEVSLAGGSDDVTIELVEGRRLRGWTEADDGRPIAGANLELTGCRDAGPRRVTSDAAGRFDVAGLMPCNLLLVASAADLAPTARTVDLARGDQVDLRVVLGRGVALGGRVLEPDGRGAVGAMVKASLRSPGREEYREARTGSDGGFLFEHVAAGVAELTASAGDRRSPPIAIEIAPDQGAVELRLASSGHVTGLVRWDDGTPAAAIGVTARAGGQNLGARTDDEGRYRLGPLSLGEVHVMASATGAPYFQGEAKGPDQARVVLAAAGELEIDPLILGRGRHVLRGQVLGPDGDAVVGALVTATAAGDAPRTGYAIDDGTFSIDDLSAPVVEVVAQAPGLGVVRAAKATVERAVALRFARPGSIAGAVSDSGRPAAAFELEVESVSLGASRQMFFMGSDGGFVVEGLPPGAYALTARAGELVGRVEVALEGGQRAAGIDIALTRPATVSGAVVTAGDQAPLANARVIGFGASGMLTAIADGQGRFALRGVVTGAPLRVVIAADGHVDHELKLHPGAGDEMIDVGEIVLDSRRR
jgi:hypothetical protein